ncbi:hypothetical protein HMF8227_02175 [Saliniradius amylolyticus]|uniref:DUF429 domain-containing protein n=1 Tax=Saliniradius amylolyticus TaxID=2183582 RepID=A0A2S2E4S2_9ALTE|nr:DUF429 domain-containing protein [Saliniradius amylolyticus]AWL12633.1 hypothetical protein HMF8227_02175 [Saliniradius amylolyticus]
MILAGLDLAWTDHKPTGIAYGKLEGDTLTVTDMAHDIMRPSKICSGLINNGVVGVAIDAPLIVNNLSGMRECEKLIGIEFGSRKASCMPSNLNKYPEHPAVELASRLEAKGFCHSNLGNKWQVECYPHPAIINIFGLPERLKYKRKRGMMVADQQYGQHRLGVLLRSLISSKVLKLEIPNDVQINHLKFDQEHYLSGYNLKANEDKLDAIICLYVAALHALKKTDFYGSIDDGYIVVPMEKQYSFSEPRIDDWVMAAWAVETAYNYYMAAEATWQVSSIVSMTNAALSIEILLKSYRLKPTHNIGAINERYSWQGNKSDGHDLSKLFDELPVSVQRKLCTSFDREMLYKYRNFFRDSKYGYERNATNRCSQTLQKIAGEMIRKTVEIYRDHGSKDPFIQSYPN